MMTRVDDVKGVTTIKEIESVAEEVLSWLQKCMQSFPEFWLLDKDAGSSAILFCSYKLCQLSEWLQGYAVARKGCSLYYEVQDEHLENTLEQIEWWKFYLMKSKEICQRATAESNTSAEQLHAEIGSGCEYNLLLPFNQRETDTSALFSSLRVDMNYWMELHHCIQQVYCSPSMEILDVSDQSKYNETIVAIYESMANDMCMFSLQNFTKYAVRIHQLVIPSSRHISILSTVSPQTGGLLISLKLSPCELPQACYFRISKHDPHTAKCIPAMQQQ